MRAFSLSHLSDAVLLRDLARLVARDRRITAALLAHIAEVDARKLHVPAGYPSMYAYCVGELRLSEEAAYKRIHAARAARRFPAIFPALADGRLHLSAVVILAPYLTEETADELLEAAANKSKSEIERLLALRFPRPDAPLRLEPVSASSSWTGLATSLSNGQLVPWPVEQHAPGRVEASPPPTQPSRMNQLGPQRFALQVTIGQATHDKLRHARELLGHQVSPGDVAQVLDRALDALISQLEKRKFAATTRPSRGQRSITRKRCVPASVRRTVWKRDRGQCTFVGQSGRRCPERKSLEFDHIDPVARGGGAAVERMRLRCRSHNQYEAERAFGAAFMIKKREEARRAAETRARAVASVTGDQADDIAVGPI